MRLKQRSLKWINSMQVRKILFTKIFFSWSLCLINMFPSMVFNLCSKFWLLLLIYSFSIFSVNFISLSQEVRGIFVIKIVLTKAKAQNSLD
jgi:hypothetical protein